MTTETHTLNLKLDAAQAASGAKTFTAAVESVRRSVRGLEKDTLGAFTQLRKVDTSGLTAATTATDKLTASTSRVDAAATKLAADMQRTMLANASATRMAEQAAQRLAIRMADIGDVQGIASVNSALAQMKAGLATAGSVLDTRKAKSGFDDVRSSLLQTSVATEHLRGEQAQLERQMTESNRAAAQHSATLDSLRSKYNPLYAASMQYAAALDEIAFAEREGALSATMAAQAREQAAARMAGSTAAMDGFTVSTGQARAATQQMGYQINDVATMALMGASPLQVISSQIFQVSQAMEMAGGKSAALGSVKTALMGLLNPSTLLIGAVIGITTALVQWGMSALVASSNTKSFTDALSDANSAVSSMRQATDLLAGSTLGSLATGYGRVNAELQVHLEKLQQIATIEATRATADAMSAVGGEYMGGWLTTDVDDMRIAFRTTNDEARALLGMLNQIKSARTFDEQFTAVQKMRKEVESVTGGLGTATGGAQAFLVQLLRAEDAGMRLRAAQDGTTNSTNAASGAASGLAYTIGTAADEAARLLSLLNGVPGALSVMGKSVEGQIASIRAQNRALNLELSEGISSAAANRRVQLETMVSTAGERGQRLNFDQIAGEWAKIGELDAAAKETERLRSAISEKNKPARSGGGKGSSGGRTAALSEEQKAVEDLNDTLTERLSSLEAERVTLALVASGQFKTTEAAELFAKAMVQGGGAVDAQTAAMIAQIDVAAKLNEELQRLSKDSVREWMDSVPGWIEAGKQIEMGAITSVRDAISEMIKTGTFDINALGEAILGTIADVMADKATKELLNLLGRDKTGPMGWLGGLMGDSFASRGDTDLASMMQGGTQAGATIGNSMVMAGQQVAAQIQAAMTGGGTQAGMSVQSGLASGSVNVRSAAQTGLAAGANSIRLAATTSGPVLASGVVQGAQAGAPILAAGVASGAGGGGGGSGSGFLSSMGGWGGLLSMAVGAFSGGGVSTSPTQFANVPLSAFHNAPHFSGGGVSDGIPALLHPNEAVVNLSGGGRIPVDLRGDSAGGGQIINAPQYITITTPNPDSFRRSEKQIALQMARSGRIAEKQNG